MQMREMITSTFVTGTPKIGILKIETSTEGRGDLVP